MKISYLKANAEHSFDASMLKILYVILEYTLNKTLAGFFEFQSRFREKKFQSLKVEKMSDLRVVKI